MQKFDSPNCQFSLTSVHCLAANKKKKMNFRNYNIKTGKQNRELDCHFTVQYHNVLTLFVVLVSASPKLHSRTRKGTTKIKGIDKIPYKKKRLACNSTPSLFPVSQYFMPTITFCGQNARTVKLLERTIIYEMICWFEVVDH